MNACSGIRLAVEGCGHGTLNAIYASITQSCKAKGWDGVDLLIIGGDFQAVRNSTDLLCMAVPAKYRQLGDFHEYYSGKRKAPYLTIFVGGNHEASNHLRELYYGGWVAPNIYYLGAANVVRLGPLRIAAMSGIWKRYHYRKGHTERLPMNQDDIRSIYHVREIDTRKLLQLRTQVDIGISHDWPQGVVWRGDHKELFRWKEHLEPDAVSGRLGNPAAKYVLDHLKPHYWFSAHLHVKYYAEITHDGPDSAEPPIPENTKGGVSAPMTKNDDEIDLDLEEDEDATTQRAAEHEGVAVKKDEKPDIDDEEDDYQDAEPGHSMDTVVDDLKAQLREEFFGSTATPDPPTSIENRLTRFLALDKCIPRRDFLQLIEITPQDSSYEITRPLEFTYDPEWLAITKVFADDVQTSLESDGIPRDKGKAYYRPLIEEQENWIASNVTVRGNVPIPHNFTVTAPVQGQLKPEFTHKPPREYLSPQTAQFCELIHIPNPFAVTEEEIEARLASGPAPSEFVQKHSLGRGRGGFRSRGHGGQRDSRGGLRVRGW